MWRNNTDSRQYPTKYLHKIIDVMILQIQGKRKMNSERKDNAEEKPRYGLYVGYPVVIIFSLIGLSGLILFILGSFVRYYLNVIFWIIGPIPVIVFLWPGIGWLFTNRLADRQREVNLDFLKDFTKAQIPHYQYV